MGYVRSAVAMTISALSAARVHACPFCDSATAKQVRAGIFDADFGWHLAAAIAPFSVLIAILLLIAYGRLPGFVASTNRHKLGADSQRPALK
jgi:hypothetical protein